MCATDFPGDDVDEDTVTLTIQEIGNLPALRDYMSKGIDRRSDVLQQWINDLADGSPLGGGWFEVEVPHHLPHNIPGRHIPTPRASLAKLTREARTVFVEGRCREVDKPTSHLTILLKLAEHHCTAEEICMIQRFVSNRAAWRERWGKGPLTALTYGGIPHGDAWNPITWTLFVQIRRATVKLLSLPENAYLRGMFGDRCALMYTRFYYLLSVEEAREMVEDLNVVQARGSVVRGLIYDSLLLEHDGPLPIDGVSLVENRCPVGRTTYSWSSARPRTVPQTRCASLTSVNGCAFQPPC